MATTTATITIASADLISDVLNMQVSSTLTTAGTSTGLTETSGIGRHTTTATAAVTIFSAANFTDDNAHKVYILNTSTTASEFIELTIGSFNGRLYAGDWAFIPWDGEDDISYTPSVATSMTVEFCVFEDN